MSTKGSVKDLLKWIGATFAATALAVMLVVAYDTVSAAEKVKPFTFTTNHLCTVKEELKKAWTIKEYFPAKGVCASGPPVLVILETEVPDYESGSLPTYHPPHKGGTMLQVRLWQGHTPVQLLIWLKSRQEAGNVEGLFTMVPEKEFREALKLWKEKEFGKGT